MKKVALITGYSSRLGKEIAEKFSKGGYVVYAGTRNLDRNKTQNSNIHLIKLDITKDASCKETVAYILKKEGRIDTLVNCAGYSIAGPVTSFNSQDYLSVLDTNVVGAFRLICEVVSHMKKRKSGEIVNITSLNGLVAFPNFGLYSSSKFAFEALSRSLRYELAKDNIRVTSVAPGAIKSETKSAPLPHKPFREKFKLLSVLMPMVTSDKIAQVILKISSTKTPPASVILGMDAKITYFLNKLLPTFFWDKLQFFVWNRK